MIVATFGSDITMNSVHFSVNGNTKQNAVNYTLTTIAEKPKTKGENKY